MNIFLVILQNGYTDLVLKNWIYYQYLKNKQTCEQLRVERHCMVAISELWLWHGVLWAQHKLIVLVQYIAGFTTRIHFVARFNIVHEQIRFL